MSVRPVLRIGFLSALTVAIAALSFVVTTPGTTRADSTFNPASTVKLCNSLTAWFIDPDLSGNPSCTDNTTPSAAADTTTTLNIPSGDLNFSSIVTFSPAGTTISPGSSMPAGTKVGARHSLMTLGTFNNACHFTVGVDFIFYNVALPNNTADPRASTNIAWPLASGDNDRFGGWVVGSGKRVSTKLAADIDDSQTAITVEDGTGIPNGH